jgi:uncharacterized protein YdeI (YjbR/CyaY-like superfamily)
MGVQDEAEEIQPVDRAAWRTWLREHHNASSGVWVITYKKSARLPGPTYEDLVLEALCFGWIDSRPGRVDDQRTKLYLSPRRRGSGWSASNKDRIAALTEQGLMTPAGQAVIDAAIADGSWNRLDASNSLEIPRELGAAFRRYPGSRRHFDGFPASVRRQLIFAVTDAKRDDTRCRRAEEIASKAQQGERAFQWQPRASR